MAQNRNIGENQPQPPAPFVTVRVGWATLRQTPQGEELVRNQAWSYGVMVPVRGEVMVQSSGQSWLIGPGSVFVRPPTVPFDYHFAAGGEFLSVGLDVALLGCIDLFLPLELPRLWQPSPTDHSLLVSAIGSLAMMQERERLYTRVLIDGLARSVAGVVCRALGPGDAQHSHEAFPRWLEDALRAVQVSPGITVGELAQIASYSEGQLRRLFRTYLGVSPHAFLQSRRLSEARDFLESTDLPIGEIASRLGFVSGPHFSRLFKQSFGVSPRQHRERSRTLPA